MKRSGCIKRLFFSTACAASLLVISCAHNQEMSAEEEQSSKSAAAEVTPLKEGAKTGETAEIKPTEEAAPKNEQKPSEDPISLLDNKPEDGSGQAVSGTPDAGVPEAPSTNAASELVPLDTKVAPAVSPDTIAATGSETEPALVDPGAVSQKPSDGFRTVSTTPETAVDNSPIGALDTPSDATPTAPVKRKAKGRRHHVAPKPVVHEARAEMPPQQAPVAQVAPTVPEIPRAAITKNGQSLNRYYFLRPGDYTEKVSQILYGTTEKGKDLLAWNGGLEKWSPGETIYYVSPLRPLDTQMISFYQEATISPHRYTAKAGDTLQAIAREIYGDTRSWKEIAVINGMKSDAKLEPGKEIVLIPPKLEAHATTVQASAAPAVQTGTLGAQGSAKNMPAPMENVAPAANVSKPSEKPSPNNDTSEALADPDEPLPGAADNKAKLANMNIGQFLMQNVFLMVAGIAVMAILFFVMIRRGRKERDSVDF